MSLVADVRPRLFHLWSRIKTTDPTGIDQCNPLFQGYRSLKEKNLLVWRHELLTLKPRSSMLVYARSRPLEGSDPSASFDFTPSSPSSKGASQQARAPPCQVMKYPAALSSSHFLFMTEKELLLDSVYEVNEGLLNEKRNPPLERKKSSILYLTIPASLSSRLT